MFNDCMIFFNPSKLKLADISLKQNTELIGEGKKTIWFISYWKSVLISVNRKESEKEKQEPAGQEKK